jgi:hypothetical protein
MQFFLHKYDYYFTQAASGLEASLSNTFQAFGYQKFISFSSNSHLKEKHKKLQGCIYGCDPTSMKIVAAL